MRSYIWLLLLVLLSLVAVSCEKENDMHHNMDYEFYSFTDFNEWYQDHTWAVKVFAQSYEFKDGLIILTPYLNCYRPGIVNVTDSFYLSINDLEIPLMVSQGQVFVDYIDDFDIPLASELHIVFQINGVDKINKFVAIPQAVTVNAPDTLDFNQPVSFSWTTANTPDYQEAECSMLYRISPYTGHGHYFNYLVRNSARQFTIPTANILAYYHENNYVEENPDNLELRSAAVYNMNFEEQNGNVVAVEVGGVYLVDN